MMIEQPPGPSTRPEVTPEQAGVFSLGAFGLRLLSAFGLLGYNFAPVGGFGVFSGSRLQGLFPYALTLGIMIATDLVLWFCLGDAYSPLHESRPLTYGSMLVYVALGRAFSHYGLLGLGAAAALGSVQFFLITNFAAWLELTRIGLYPATIAGLLQCYDAGIPFYQNTFVSDLCFPFVFAALHAVWLKASRTGRRAAEAQHS